jgi:hypothetical protein
MSQQERTVGGEPVLLLLEASDVCGQLRREGRLVLLRGYMWTSAG